MGRFIESPHLGSPRRRRVNSIGATVSKTPDTGYRSPLWQIRGRRPDGFFSSGDMMAAGRSFAFFPCYHFCRSSKCRQACDQATLPPWKLMTRVFILMQLSMAWDFQRYSWFILGHSLLQPYSICAATFVACSIYGMTTKRDLTIFG